MSTQFILHSKQRNYLLNIPSSQRKCESDQLQSTTEYRDRPNSIIHNIFSSAFIRSFILHPFNTLPTLREFVWSPPLRCTLYYYRVTLSEVTQSSCRDTRNPKNSTINLIPRHFPGCKNIPRASSVLLSRTAPQQILGNILSPGYPTYYHPNTPRTRGRDREYKVNPINESKKRLKFGGSARAAAASVPSVHRIASECEAMLVQCGFFPLFVEYFEI